MFITEWGRFCSKVGEVVEAITKRASYNKVGHKVNKTFSPKCFFIYERLQNRLNYLFSTFIQR